MSRVGKKPVPVPDKVKVKIEKGMIFTEGPKGKLDWTLPEHVEVNQEGSQILVKRLREDNVGHAMQGTTRAYISNMIKGVNEGYTKNLEIQGVGYKAQAQGKNITLQLGFSHPVVYLIPEDITVKTPKPTQIIVEGIDKAKVGQVAADIRDFLKPEPYKGKGIRYQGEYVRKKAGKAVA
ncbi:MAG: 50S ribosomal protein L6 [Candidatus Omnitrophota bacterium]